MGTRSLTHVVDADGTCLMTLYRQFDGYPSGMGSDLFEFLKDMKIINGISGQKAGEAASMGCLAAQLVANLKDGIGNVYLYPPKSSDCWEEYTYFVGMNPDREPNPNGFGGQSSVVILCYDGENTFEINEETIKNDGCLEQFKIAGGATTAVAALTQSQDKG